MSDNQEKRMKYATAWRRIPAARKKGFYLEVVTLCESIMADRVLSYLHRVNPAGKTDIHTPFAQLIKEWAASCEGEQRGTDSARTLIDHVDQWRRQRNEVVHGLVKSKPSTETKTVRQFMALAKETADCGIGLARQVENWQRRDKRRMLKATKDSVQ